ncbi:MAG TPA: LON peptidase substrate-binding domain-containing protein [Thermoleophilaceae bacterium]|nr:LON peptidase substrate-binding domain-containing protein [Thermoleophilaceae bacterium]
MARTLERYPLFPLGLVLLPHELVPLHIFEERYKLMVGECLEGETGFGILWLSDDGLKDVGCCARITRVLERFEDGRLNILVEGTDPFVLRRRIEELPYPAGDVELLEDPEGAEPSPDTLERARGRYADLVERASDSRPDAEALEQLGAYAMAATLDVSPDAKQELLELRSEQARLERLEVLLADTMRRLALAEEAAQRAAGNGSMRAR